MPTTNVVVVGMNLLVRLEGLIKRHQLHTLTSPGPICLDPVLEAYESVYASMPYFVQAVTFRWREAGERITLVSLNEGLQEPQESANRRHAQAHEFAHLWANHKGTEFIMWGVAALPRCTGLDSYIHSKQEHQCECIAAVLLVPVWMLRELEGDSAYVAGVLDVPEHLVRLRWDVFQRFGR